MVGVPRFELGSKRPKRPSIGQTNPYALVVCHGVSPMNFTQRTSSVSRPVVEPVLQPPPAPSALRQERPPRSFEGGSKQNRRQRPLLHQRDLVIFEATHAWKWTLFVPREPWMTSVRAVRLGVRWACLQVPLPSIIRHRTCTPSPLPRFRPMQSHSGGIDLSVGGVQSIGDRTGNG